MSPDLESKKTSARANFRRSRSALDIRSHLMAQPQLKTTTNLPSTKSNPMRRSRSACDLKIQTGSLLKRTVPSTSTNNLHTIKSNSISRSTCDLKLAGRTMLKRTAQQPTTIPAKLKKENSSSTSTSTGISATNSRLIGAKPKLVVAVKNQVKKKFSLKIRGKINLSFSRLKNQLLKLLNQKQCQKNLHHTITRVVSMIY